MVTPATLCEAYPRHNVITARDLIPRRIFLVALFSRYPRRRVTARPSNQRDRVITLLLSPCCVQTLQHLKVTIYTELAWLTHTGDDRETSSKRMANSLAGAC